MCELDYGGEACSVYTNTWRRARKAHKCRSCLSGIEPGSKYLRHFQVFDGSVHDAKVCIKCGHAYEAFVKEHHGASYPPDDIARSLDECIDNGDDASRKRWRPVLSALNRRRTTARSS